MSQLTQFHLFPNPPPELQTLIWQTYGNDARDLRPFTRGWTSTSSTSRYLPKPLDDDHWFFKIRKLAINVYNPFSQVWTVSAFDQDTLRRHKGLATIYLVSGEGASDEYFWPEKTSNGFIRQVWIPHMDNTRNLFSAIYKDQTARPDIHLVVEGSPKALAMMALDDGLWQQR
ncbi:uncharacterized protein PG986_010465 [Apiospora aurea]|uniref:Uncharacterized protein n=1 Tax=Apiospora aurea TaxID=335848 RepID=A0ABR1Q2C8_9PEZI